METEGKRNGQTRAHVLTFLALSGLLAAAGLWTPRDTGVPLCFFRWHTGLACPGCGMTRSIAALGHFDLEAALRYHAFGPLIAAGIVVAWIVLGLGLLTGRDFMPDLNARWMTWSALALAGAFLAYWGFRVLLGVAP